MKRISSAQSGCQRLQGTMVRTPVRPEQPRGVHAQSAPASGNQRRGTNSLSPTRLLPKDREHSQYKHTRNEPDKCSPSRTRAGSATMPALAPCAAFLALSQQCLAPGILVRGATDAALSMPLVPVLERSLVSVRSSECPWYATLISFIDMNHHPWHCCMELQAYRGPSPCSRCKADS